MKKSIFSIVLSIIMLCNQLPVTVLAAESDISVVNDEAQISDGGEEMVDNWNSVIASENTTITLSNSVTIDAGTYDLTDKTVTFEGTANIEGNVTITGGTIFRGVNNNNALFSVNDGDSLTLNHITVDGQKDKVTASNPLLDISTGGSVILGEDSILTNNKCSADGEGSAVTVNEGTLNIEGGRIKQNSGEGTTIKTYYGATVTMTGGEISGNRNSKHGGAIQIYGKTPSSEAKKKLTTFTMSGGTICNNTAGGVGGGVAVSAEAKFVMSGGTICNNTSGDKGGGVAFSEVASNNISMEISGSAKITENNKNGTVNNLEIGEANLLKVTGALSDANIGITTSRSNAFTTSEGNIVPADYMNQFTSDNTDYRVDDDGNHQLLLKETSIEETPEEEIHSHSICGDDVCNVHGDEMLYTPLSTYLGRVGDGKYNGKRIAEAGNYYLDKDISLNEADNLQIAADVSLCLNGHTLTYNGTNMAVYVANGATFNICDCSEGKTGMITTDKQEAKTVELSYGTVNLYSGTLKSMGSNAFYGHVDDGDVIFNQYGGTLQSNGTDSAVLMEGDDELTAAYKLYDGTVENTYDNSWAATIEICENADLYISGAPVIRTSTAEGCHHLKIEKPIHIMGALTAVQPEYSVMYMHLDENLDEYEFTGIITDGWDEHMDNATCENYFIAVVPDYYVLKDISGELKIVKAQYVAKPVITEGGTFSDTKQITITCTTSDVDIYYTLDGTSPNRTSSNGTSTEYNGPFTINGSAVVRAIAVRADDSLRDSEIAQQVFELENDVNFKKRIEEFELTDEVITGELKNSGINTVEVLKNELEKIIEFQDNGAYEGNIEVKDIKLQFSLNQGSTWIDATEENFPEEGITTILPYPSGTGKDTHDFFVTHMFTTTSTRLGTIAGETENPEVTETEEGIQVTLKGLSPVAIGYKATTTGGSGSGNTPPPS
ncbi:MAG: chitobiase/beta-hexosaminidase C-terminal domain-containing protein, partial [Lachnospiraceae bacterium]|nr:chitobiase/beta-hexosaminidase C-terminal domain-containing protein [Lachnospiraceae bacterium]